MPVIARGTSWRTGQGTGSLTPSGHQLRRWAQRCGQRRAQVTLRDAGLGVMKDAAEVA